VDAAADGCEYPGWPRTVGPISRTPAARTVDSAGSGHAAVHGARGGAQGGAGRPPSSFGFDGLRYDEREIDCQRPRPPSRRRPSACFSLLSGTWILGARVRDAPIGRVSMPTLHLEHGFPVSILNSSMVASIFSRSSHGFFNLVSM
jgi:hypothetical protein